MKKDNWKKSWELAKGLLPTILYIGVIIFLLGMLPNRTLFTTVLLVVIASLVLKLFNAVKDKQEVEPKEFFLSMIKTALFMTTFLLVWRFLGRFGVVGFVVGIVLYVTYVLIKRRADYMKAVRTVEMQLFGKENNIRGKKK